MADGITTAEAANGALTAGTPWPYLIVKPAAAQSPGAIRRVLEPELAKGFIQVDRVVLEVEDTSERKQTGRAFLIFPQGTNMDVADGIVKQAVTTYGWTVWRPDTGAGALAAWWDRVVGPKVPVGGPQEEIGSAGAAGAGSPNPPSFTDDAERAVKWGLGATAALGAGLVLRGLWLLRGDAKRARGHAAQRRRRGRHQGGRRG